MSPHTSERCCKDNDRNAGGVHHYISYYGCVTQKLIRVKSDPAGSLLVAIIDPAGSHLAAKSDPPLQKVIRVQILVDSSLF